MDPPVRLHGIMATSGDASPSGLSPLERIIDDATVAGLLPLDGDGTEGDTRGEHRTEGDTLQPAALESLAQGLQGQRLRLSGQPPDLDLVATNTASAAVAVRSGIATPPPLIATDMGRVHREPNAGDLAKLQTLQDVSAWARPWLR